MTPELTPKGSETGPEGDPIARLKAGLNEDEQRARFRLKELDAYGASEVEPEHMLRIVAAVRKILAEVVPAMNESDDQLEQEFGMQGDPPQPYLSEILVKILADVYDSPGGSLSTT